MPHNEADQRKIIKLYDEQFRRYHCLLIGFTAKLTEAQDRQICAQWIQMLCDLHLENIEVKCNRNAFFQYFLQIVQKASVEESDGETSHPLTNLQQESLQDMGTIQHPAWLEQQLHDLESIMKFPKKVPYFAHWSKDHRTYVAAKALPQHGALIYLAVSKDPRMGWDNLTETVLEETHDDSSAQD